MVKGRKSSDARCTWRQAEDRSLTDDSHLGFFVISIPNPAVLKTYRIQDIILYNLQSSSGCLHAVGMHCRIEPVIVCLIYLFIYSLVPDRAK